jgi:hypothetical protein
MELLTERVEQAIRELLATRVAPADRGELVNRR